MSDRLPGKSLAAQGLSLPPDRTVKPVTALPDGIGQSLGRILRPQAAYRWLLPSVAAITPQYIESTLRGALAGNHVQAWELYDLMMDTWPELAAVCSELIEGVQKKKMVIEPCNDEEQEPDPEALARHKLVCQALKSMRPDAAADENDIRGTIKDILAAWFQGQSVLEVNWQTLDTDSGAAIVPKSTYWVHPVCYAWSLAGRLGLRVELDALRENSQAARDSAGKMTTPWNYVTSQPMPSQISDFPDCKFLVAVSKGKSGTALGGARLRVLAWWWCAANFSADWLLNRAQIFGLPFRWASYDPSAPDAVVNKVCDMLQNMGSAGWAAFPAGTTLELKEAAQGGDSSPQGDLHDRADRYARSLILGQTLTGANTSAKGGGLAFGETEAGVKSDRIEAAAQFAADVLNLQLIPFILRLNHGDETFAPTARFLEDSEGGLSDAQRDTTLAGGGMTIGVNYLRRKYNIPAPEEGEKTIGGSLAPQANPLQPLTPTPTGIPAEDQSTDSDPAVESRNASESAPATPADKAVLIAAIKEEFYSLNKRLAAIAEITHPEVQHAKLSAVLADLENFRKDIDKDPAVANAIYKILAAGVANGIAESAKHHA